MSRNIQIIFVYLLYLLCMIAVIIPAGCQTSPTPKTQESVKAPPPEVEKAPEKKERKIVEAAGRSVEGQAIKAVLFKGENPELGILFLASVCGDESAGTGLLYHLVEFLEKRPGLYANRVIAVMPNVNPDGVRHNRRENANHVDIAHNFSEPNKEPETRAILSVIENMQKENVKKLRIVSIRQLNSIDYDGPDAYGLARHMKSLCDLQIKRWGSTSDSLGGYGEKHGIPVITFGLPTDDATKRNGMNDAELWERYKGALVAAIEYNQAVDADSDAERAAKHIARGKSFFNEKNYVSAIVEFTKAYRLDRRKQEVRQYLCSSHFNNGVILYGEEKYMSALKAFGAAEKYQKGCNNSLEYIEKCKTQIRVINWNEGRKFFNQNQWNEAIKSFKKVLQVYPDDADAKEMIARARANVKNESNLNQLLTSGKKYFEQRRWDLAIAQFENALNIDPDEQTARQSLYDSYLEKGKEQFEKGSYRNAMEAFNAAQTYHATDEVRALIDKSHKAYLDKHYTLGVKSYENGKGPEAIEAFKTVLEMDTEYKDAGKLLEISTLREEGLKKYRAKAYDQAVADLLKVLEVKQEDDIKLGDEITTKHLGLSYFEMGMESYQNSDYKQAVESFTAALKHAPEDPQSLKYLGLSKKMYNEKKYMEGVSLMSKGRWDDAIDLFEMCYPGSEAFDLKIREAKNRAYYEKAVALMKEKRWDNAFENFEMIQAAGDEAFDQKVRQLKNEALYRKGVELVSKKRWNEALAAFDKTEPADEVFGQKIQKAKEDAYYKKGKDFMAIENWDQAVDAFLNLPGDYKDVGRLITLSRRNKENDASYQQALQYANAGRCDEAVTEFEKVDPEFKDTAQRLKAVKEICYERHLKAGEDFLNNENYLSAIESFNLAWHYSGQTSTQSSQGMSRCKFILYRRGNEFNDTGQWDKAIVYFKKIYEVDPDYEDVGRKIREIKTNLEVTIDLKAQEIQGLKDKRRGNPGDKSLSRELQEAEKHMDELRRLLQLLPRL